MISSRWPFEFLDRLDRRERRVVMAGAGISAATLILVFGILPFARTWSERSASLAARSEQLGRLEALVEREDDLRQAVEELQQRRDLMARALLTGSTPVLAASVLQTLVQSYAEESLVLLPRVDASREFPAAEDGLVPVGLQLTAQGDIYGLVNFLFLLQHGEKLLVIDELRVSASSPRRGREPETLSWTIHLHGFYAPEEAQS